MDFRKMFMIYVICAQMWEENIVKKQKFEAMRVFFRLTAFPRWMKQTCLPCPPQRDTEATGNEFYVFSYFEDILRVVSINDVTLLIQDSIYRLTQDINVYVQK